MPVFGCRWDTDTGLDTRPGGPRWEGRRGHSLAGARRSSKQCDVLAQSPQCKAPTSESVGRAHCSNRPGGIVTSGATGRVLSHEGNGPQPTAPDECFGDASIVRTASQRVIALPRRRSSARGRRWPSLGRRSDRRGQGSWLGGRPGSAYANGRLRALGPRPCSRRHVDDWRSKDSHGAGRLLARLLLIALGADVGEEGRYGSVEGLMEERADDRCRDEAGRAECLPATAPTAHPTIRCESQRVSGSG